MNRDRLLADAKAKALELAAITRRRSRRLPNLPGPSARVAMNMAVDGFVTAGKATTYDMVVADALAAVLSAARRTSPRR